MYWSDRDTRKIAYYWLQGKMGMNKYQAHIGKFNKQECEKLLGILEKELTEQGFNHSVHKD